jgi:hypothetical protein
MNFHREVLRSAAEATQTTGARPASRAQSMAVRTADLAHFAAQQTATTEETVTDDTVCAW